MRLTSASGMYMEKLNELLSYDMVCVAYKGEQAFFYSQTKVLPGDHSFSLRPIDSAELDRQLNKWGNREQAAALIRDNSFHRFEWHDRQRNQRTQRLRELRYKVMERFFFYCLPWDRESH